jgi:hypothetical protein
MGKPITDDDFVSVLIVPLPPTYDELLELFTMSTDMNKTMITPDLVYKMVCDAYNEHLLRQEANGNSQDKSFAASTHKPKDKRNIECFKCHKKGHIKADCWAKGGGKEGQEPRCRQGSMQENMAVASDKTEDELRTTIEVINMEDDIATTAAVVTSAVRPNKWVYTMLYDSGTSRHMTLHQEHFITYQQIDPHPTMVADKGVFYTIGQGDICIQVPNEDKAMEVILRDTLYTLEMGLTVISVGRIANAGHTVAFEGNICKIKNQSGDIIGSIPAGPNGLYKVKRAYTVTDEREQVDMLTLHR